MAGEGGAEGQRVNQPAVSLGYFRLVCVCMFVCVYACMHGRGHACHCEKD